MSHSHMEKMCETECANIKNKPSKCVKMHLCFKSYNLKVYQKIFVVIYDSMCSGH